MKFIFNHKQTQKKTLNENVLALRFKVFGTKGQTIYFFLKIPLSNKKRTEKKTKKKKKRKNN